MSAPGAILKAMHAVMSEVGAISKDRNNVQQSYNFRGVDDVLKALQPLFIKHGIICVQEVLEHSREILPTARGGTMASVRLKVKHTYHCVADGSAVSCVTWGEAMDSGDKASNKAMAVALKYAHFFSFTIPTEEPLDTENESPEMERALPQSGKVATVPASRPAARPAQATKPAQRTSSGVVFPNYGTSKGLPVSGASKKDLDYYRNGALRTLNDPAKAKFHEKERVLLDAIERELAMGAPQQGDNEPPPPTDDDYRSGGEYERNKPDANF